MSVVRHAVRRIPAEWPAKFNTLFVLFFLSLTFGVVPNADLTPHDIEWAGWLLLGAFGGIAAVRHVAIDDRTAWLRREPRRASIHPTLWQHIQFKIRILRSDAANFYLYEYRSADALLITAKNSGTHWLKFMLSSSLAHQYGLPVPRHSSGTHANEIIGGRLRRHGQHGGLPRIGHSHTVPSIVFRWPWFTRRLRRPPVVVLVRDIKAAMASYYVKWQHRVPEPFAEFVRGDPSGCRYKGDIWWYLRFFNRWGDAAAANPGQVLVVRYEDLLAEPEACLRRIFVHWCLRSDQESLAAALRFFDRDTIQTRLDPRDTEIIVPHAKASAAMTYSAADDAFVRTLMQRYLRHDFGYGYLAQR